MTVFFGLYAFLFGAAVGSFLNVVVARLPRRESLVSPGSKCPTCGRPIRFYDNIPIVSFLILGARCRDCGTKISPCYPVTEFVTACTFTGIFLRFGATSTTVVFCLFAAAMIAVFRIDLEHMIIPDAITLNGIPVGMAAAICGFIPGVDWKWTIIGTLLGGAVLYVPALIYEWLRGVEGLGGGDVKLLAMIGAFTGPLGVIFVLLFSSLVGSIIGMAGMVIRSTTSTTPIPFGPFIAAAAFLYLFAGHEIIRGFFNLSLHF
jgi:leader peptidase (prepilin peptidase)/N-methyltransferase